MSDEYSDIGPPYDASGFHEDSENNVEPVVSNDYLVEAANDGDIPFLNHTSVGDDLPPTSN